MQIFIKFFFIFILGFNALIAGDFLMPDEAFKPYSKVNDKAQIESGIVLGKHIYLYADKVKLDLVSMGGIALADKISPKSVEHDGEKVYFDRADFILELKNIGNVSGMQEVTLNLSYQGCSEDGLCYEPMTQKYTFNIDTTKLSHATNTATVDKQETQVAEKSQTDTIAETIKSGNVLIILLTFFGFGLLLAMTPCVFPMIPIISGLIVSQGEDITTKKAFMLSVVYVLAMAVAYTIAGVFAGLFGSNLQAALQTPWVIYSFSFIFVALAFSMFGFYELKLPDSIVNKVSSSNNRSGYIGVAIMGFLSALIVGPCVAAPLAGALVYIGQTGDALFGGMALFSMSIGMGLPLIVVGVSAGKFMPRPGAWMTMVTAIFGVMMLGVAIWMLEKIVDASVIMVLYGMLGLGFSLYLGAFEREGHIFKRSVALIMFIYSVSLIIGFLGGSSSMTKPLSFLKSEVVMASGTSAVHQENSFEIVKSISELDTLLDKNRGKKILLDFSAEWCTSCKELESITFADAKVKAKMSEFVLIRADITDNNEDEKALSAAYGVFGPPAIIFFDENLKVKKAKTIIGFIEPEEFLVHLNTL